MLTLGEGEGRPLSKGLGGTVSASPNADGSADPDSRRRFAKALHDVLAFKLQKRYDGMTTLSILPSLQRPRAAWATVASAYSTCD